jgi:hypothetical protein
MAGGFVIGGSVFLVLSIFDTFSGLHSVEMRDEIDKVLSSPTGEGLGLSVSDALAVMRVGLMLAGACAAAAAVLGVYALQRNRAARLALSILAVPILITAPLTGGLMGALVAAATLMLWSGPARDWFAGRPVRELEPPARQQRPGPWEKTMPPGSGRTAEPGQHPDPTTPPVDGNGDSPSEAATPAPASSLSTAGSSTQPVPTPGFGEVPAQQVPPPDSAWLPPPFEAAAGANAVPVSVRVACILTWVFSGTVALLYAGALVALVALQDRIVDYVAKSPEWQRSELNPDMLVPLLWVGCLMFLGWALGACLLAWFAWRRHNWARWLLAGSAGTSLVAAVFAFPVGIPHMLAAMLAIVGLFSATARQWFSVGPSQAGPPPGPGEWPPPQQGQYPTGPPQSDQEPGQQPQRTPPSGGKPPVW